MDSFREIKARRGYSISYMGKTLLSTIDPVTQGERLAGKTPLKERTLYFCPSPLYGYGLSLLLEKIPPDSKVICVEADEKLFEVSCNAINEIDKTCPLIKAKTSESVCAYIRDTYGERAFRRVEPIHLTGGWQLYPELYEDMARALRREIALEWGNAITMIHLGRLYARNFIRNLSLLPSSEQLASLNFLSAPVLVLGAGPSLDSILDEFTALWGTEIPEPEKRPFKIICVDTCLPCLLERAIVPDLVVILESQHWNLGDFIGGRSHKIDTILDLSSLPASSRVLEGKRYLCWTAWTELGLFRRLREAGILNEAVAPLGSVGLSAVALALNAGSGPVLTGGLDFSYTPEAYHSSSTPEHTARYIRQNRFQSLINPNLAYRKKTFPASSKNGKTVRSDPVMRNYRDLFEEEFGGNPRLLDIDGPGLPLGLKTISPSEAFAVLRGEAALSSPWKIPVKEAAAAVQTRQMEDFIRREIKSLLDLRDMLSGSSAQEPERLEELLLNADYVWAHFPEYAGRGKSRQPGKELSFLKRVRIEIDPFIKCWEMSLLELDRNK